MIPLLLTQTIILFQDTSLVYVISATDFVGAASKIAQRDGTPDRDVPVRRRRLFRASATRCRSCVKLLQKKIAVIR